MLRKASIEATVAPGTPPSDGGAPRFLVWVATADEADAKAAIHPFLEHVEADRAEPGEGAPAYATWAVRGALRFALAAFLIALAVGGLARLLARLFR